ncbi:MAG: hypothetical protein WBD51_10835, partial [Burkholderiaceae bacterium]
GNKNAWDSSEFINSAISLLAGDLSQEANEAMTNLLRADEDGYTAWLSSMLANQRRLVAESIYRPPTIGELQATFLHQRPKHASEVQAVAIRAFKDLQARIFGNATDTFERFYEKGSPLSENRCRNVLIDLLTPIEFDIQLTPEEAMPRGSRVDVAFRLGPIRVPLEAKGQWHRQIWSAAEEQLLNLYTIDHQSEGFGIFLVFWFGEEVQKSKKPKNPPKGLRKPRSARDMQMMLIEQASESVRQKISFFVLDLSHQ